MENESIIKMWKEYQKVNPNSPAEYEAWAFGDSSEMADELADLVLKGAKTATASNYLLYELQNEELPYPGLHNVILDGSGEAVAIVETILVEVVPFDDVTEEHAYMEGEGDRTLQYWRKVHQEFFSKELYKVNKEFHQKIPVVCERFKLIFKK